MQVGTTTAITAVGKFDPWPPKTWIDAPGISFCPEQTPGKFSVEVGADVPIGPHLIRVFNESGASAPRFLIVTADPQRVEAEPNDEAAKAPTIERLPTTIDGRLNKSGDVDSFAVKLEAGQTLIASLEAFVLASPVDAVLRLVDSRGLEMALNHDDGRTLDPFLTWTAKVADTYVVQVFGFAHPATSDVRFTGSDACVYRLHLSRGPQTRYTVPLGVQRAKPAKLRLFGWNLGSAFGRELAVDGPAISTASDRATWRSPEFENIHALPLGDGPELVEPDLITRDRELPDLVPPFAITGGIEKSGEEDRFGFSATKGERLVLEIQSASLGFPLDAWLGIQNAKGKELARNDDGTNADPVLEWTAPATGSYVAVVGSVLHRSGTDHLYRLSIQPARPGFKAVIAEPGFTVEPGKTIKIKVTGKRIHGFKSKLTAAVAGLPEGLTANPVEMGETEKEITLQVTASADAKPFCGPIEIKFSEGDSGVVHPAIHELGVVPARNGVPRGFYGLVIKSTDQLWLTVLAATPPKPAAGK